MCVQKPAYYFQDTFSEGFYPKQTLSVGGWLSVPKWSDEPLYLLKNISIGWERNTERKSASLQDGGDWCELGEREESINSAGHG